MKFSQIGITWGALGSPMLEAKPMVVAGQNYLANEGWCDRVEFEGEIHV
jgi:hypothetical protein